MTGVPPGPVTPLTWNFARPFPAICTFDFVETTVGVQTHDKSGRNHQAYLWQYGTPGGSVVFDFRMGRGREGPKLFLGQFEGILQTDGYSAYDHTGGLKLVHAACWAHARRKVYEALKLNPGYAPAHLILGSLLAADLRTVPEAIPHLERAAESMPAARVTLEQVRRALNPK